ncbi:MAG: hypothetical protein A3H71_01765 [Candidatus Sungbacteria bacterium RIFCSPLOWO2_02_FULL_48_13b]|uniref:SHS2 domain-containing protein n=2 Tax=Candidatus Sungiibacteriota TaxID=1817917 RepID=A0A1G2LI64_9BACT|nr:MAG: hypothetical protein A3C12_02230 [Candidatus Sungbacteria bacterium RIFCSPHIGHO2_02_FULL_49_20]OHA11194.1 MAG: hypothetical protein A3H71_01765 [Candidatus Sungbacteria bacterium RIFCSPLOWO2_02_FULL_48_13b]
MFGWFNFHPRISVAVDLSRASAKFLAFRFDARAKTVNYVDHQTSTWGGKPDALEAFIHGLEVTGHFIDSVGQEGQIGSILLSVPNSLLILEARQFRFVRPEPSRAVTAAELSELWQQVRSAPADSLLPQGLTAHAYEIFPPVAEEFHLDGYLLSGKISGEGREVSAAAIIAAWPVECVEALSHFRKRFADVEIKPIPELDVIRGYIHLRQGSQASGVAIDIGALDSTLILLSRGVIEDIWVFPFGSVDVTEAIARELGVTFEEAESFKRQWSSGVLDDDRRSRVEKAAAFPIEYWKREWGSLLATRAETTVIAPTIYLLGRGAFLPSVVGALGDGDWLELFSSGRGGEATILLPRELKDRYFPGWPFDDAGDAVLFSLVSRIIQEDHGMRSV